MGMGSVWLKPSQGLCACWLGSTLWRLASTFSDRRWPWQGLSFSVKSLPVPCDLSVTHPFDWYIAAMTWIGLTNNEPASGYPHTDLLYVCVCAGIGLVGAFMGAFFFSVCMYLIGALGGFYLAVWLLSWKASLIITVVSGSPPFHPSLISLLY